MVWNAFAHSIDHNWDQLCDVSLDNSCQFTDTPVIPNTTIGQVSLQLIQGASPLFYPQTAGVDFGF